MITGGTIWSIIRGHIPRKQWVSSEDIYAIVELHANLDEEDRRPQSPMSKIPRWKILVCNVLENRVKKGKIMSRKRSDRAGNTVS